VVENGHMIKAANAHSPRPRRATRATQQVIPMRVIEKEAAAEPVPTVQN